MKLLCRALCVLYLLLCQARAQQDVDQQVDDFKPTSDDDLIIYTRKFSVKLGFRDISGAKSSFSGHGLLSSVSDIGDTTSLVARTYQDGNVSLDTRTALDPSGSAGPITPDGKTNNWTYTNDSQAAVYNGLIAMHSYAAAVDDSALRKKNIGSALGVELTAERDMGKLFGTRIQWGLIGGMSMNQVFAQSTYTTAASVTTTTDYYSLFGHAAPGAGYVPPAVSGVGNSVLVSEVPLRRDVSTATVDGAVTNTSRLHGGYMTFRAGPTLMVPITERLSGHFSAGLALVYAGTSFEMAQTFMPETGSSITQIVRDGASKILPGYYADADLQFALNENSGLYLGAVYQGSGSYSQSISDNTDQTVYTSRVDLSKLQGIRAGVSFKF